MEADTGIRIDALIPTLNNENNCKTRKFIPTAIYNGRSEEQVVRKVDRQAENYNERKRLMRRWLGIGIEKLQTVRRPENMSP